MTSRFSQRATGVAAATAIVLLVVLIVLLWTNVGQDIFHGSPRKKINVGGLPPSRNDSLAGSDFRTSYLQNDLFSRVPDLGQPEEIRLSGAAAAENEEMEMEKPISREYVKPIKISPLGLHQDDLLYGSDQLTGDTSAGDPIQLRHHSGHFRHKAANIWDPHPMYEFTAFQKKFNLVLEHDSKFASPSLQVTHIWHNTSARRLPTIKSNGCFYKGYVKGDPASSVAVSLCHGMVSGSTGSARCTHLTHLTPSDFVIGGPSIISETGHIRTSTGNYFIQPSEQSSDHAKPIEHIIYAMSGAKELGKDFNHCGLVDDYDHDKKKMSSAELRLQSKAEPDVLYDYDADDYLHHVHSGTRGEDPFDSHSSEKNFQKKRSRRSVSEEYFVEMLVVADSSMANYHGGDVENYILALMYIVSGIFKDASIGNPITIALVKLEILHHKNFAQHRYPPHDGVSAAEMLREFCRYQASSKSGDHDTALLLTRENICRNASAQKCETLGLAELGTMCDKKSSCSLVQDNGLSAAFTIAHELGHVLNMPHDDAEMKCRVHTNGDSVSHVMSTSLKEGTDPWSWSECSRHFLTEFLEHSHCLKDPPIKDYITENGFSDVLPGETIEGNRQCELLYGEGSRICSYMPVCSALWCHKVDSEGCQTLHMPWGDGTPCGEGAWCQKGVCVEKDRKALEKVDGGWGPWQGFGACSRTCGGGVKKSYRDCDNPRPQNGGKYCTGRRVRYRSCGTRDCPEGSKGFREAQCAAFDYNSHNIHGVPSTVRWIPKYGLSGDDRCILYCRVSHSNLYYPLKEKVIDGTPCAPESFDICVNGQCKPAGCDHILYSDVRLDQCGKCGGNNDTCRLIQGFFNTSAEEQGYRTVVRIPAGSSNLDIRQHGIQEPGKRDDNFLVLKDGVTGGRLLNNENILTTFRKIIFYDGVALEYSGCLSPVERINASRPLKRDLLVEVLSAGSLTPPDITYQYTVPKSNEQKHMWRHLDDEWDSCDQVCNGERRRMMVCVAVETNEIVGESYCSSIRKPAPIVEECNTNCVLKWRITGRTECSSNCGSGVRRVTKECVQEIAGYSQPYPIQNSSCLHLPNPPPDIEPCEGPCNIFNWKYEEWDPCSKSCGSGIQNRDAYCADELGRRVGDEKCNAEDKIVQRVCQPQNCPTWSYGEWSSCSVTCGIGIQTRGHWCQLDNQVIDMSYCYGDTLPVYQKKCVMLCPTWSFSKWGACSVTCGEGIRRRTVFCKSTEGKVVNDVLCWNQPKPQNQMTERCGTQCPHQYYPKSNQTIRDHRTRFPHRSGFRWDDSAAWEPCSKTCGNGTQKRVVHCRNLRDMIVTDMACRHLKKPPVQQICYQRACPTGWKYGWKTEPWSSCSKTCGRGERTRVVKCVKISLDNNNSISSYNDYHQGPYWIDDGRVDDNNCDRQNKPRERRKCTKKLCPLTWIKGEWSKCSKECGEGYQNRTITCHQVNNYNWLDPTPIGNEFCKALERPTLSRVCKIRDCDAALYWSPERWLPCTERCGRKGIQKMEYTCRDRYGRILHRSECKKKDIPKPPPKSKPCNRRPCDKINCKEIQLQTDARTDGEYYILVGGRKMPIYCKGMNTNSPTEYLTLSRSEDNYSEFPNRRLREHTYRRHADRWYDGCKCSVNTDWKSGYTMFSKVRLLVDTLEIDTQDFTFSKQISGHPIGLAEAGDCCSQPECIQGNFRLNITGTALMIPPTQDWVAKPYDSRHKAKIQIDKLGSQVILGRCSCGTCTPLAPGRLKLQVQPP